MTARTNPVTMEPARRPPSAYKDIEPTIIGTRTARSEGTIIFFNAPWVEMETHLS